MRRPTILLLALGLFGPGGFQPLTEAASLEPGADDAQPWIAEGVALAELVLARGTEIDGRIHTEFVFRRTEDLLGSFPAYFKVHAPGGRYMGEAKDDSRLPKLEAGAEYILFLQASGAGLSFTNGVLGARPAAEADLDAVRNIAASRSTDQDFSAFATDPVTVSFSVTSSGLLETDGAKRFVSPDGGIPIPVIADVSTLPDGLTEPQALQALANALAAWESASSIRFDLQGTEVFTQSANGYGKDDGYVIRIQMHDNFDEIPDGSSTLGFGGSGYSLSTELGGIIDGRSFNRSNYGFVVMNHPKNTLQDPVTFEEVLTHEIGHAIGLAHSSETQLESDPYLAEAIMFFQAHADGRGAQLGSYDSDTIIKAYPANTPPYGVEQIFYAITQPSGSLANPEVNEVLLGGLDLQGDPVSIQVVSKAENNGSFSLSGSRLSYTPNAFFSDGTVSNMESGSFDRYEYRLSDGTNLSPVLEVRNVGFRGDTYPVAAKDGLPDAWVTQFFGSASAGLAEEDPDGDGLSNLEEFLSGSDPTDPGSRLQIESFADGELTWSSGPFGAYQLQRSTDLSSWNTVALYGEGVDGDGVTATTADRDPAENRTFYRIKAVTPLENP